MLREQSVINREAFDYSRILEEKSHLPLVKGIVEADNYRTAARDQGFRRNRNGMALYKLCHWAFDEGMRGVSDNMRSSFLPD